LSLRRPVKYKYKIQIITAFRIINKIITARAEFFIRFSQKKKTRRCLMKKLYNLLRKNLKFRR